MAVRLSDQAVRMIAVFDTETDVGAIDCIIDDEYDRVVFVVPAGSMGKAIGPAGRHVTRVEEKVGQSIELVEHAADPDTFIANALSPAAVYNVTLSGDDETVAYVEVDQADRGIAIGRDGRNISMARQLARRHFDIDAIELL